MKVLLVSVILPVYNVEDYLEECLDSLLAQSTDAFEIICINDGSTDTSSQILTAYSSKFQGRMRIFTTKNQGVAGARNHGLDMASGSYIYFLDSDDYIEPTTIDSCLKEMIKHDADLVVFDAEAFCDDPSLVGLTNMNYERNLPKTVYVNESIFVDSYKSTYIVQPCCYFFKKEVFGYLRFISGILHEDHYFTTLLYLKSRKTIVLNNKFFKRRVRPDSITTSTLKMAHAIGYYETSARLYNELYASCEVKLFKPVFKRYVNLLLQAAISKEKSILQNESTRMPMRRKLTLLKQYGPMMNWKTLLILVSKAAFIFLKSIRGKR